MLKFDLIDCDADRDMGDISSLKANVEKLGLLQPIILKREGVRFRVVDGRRRFAVCKELFPSLADEHYRLCDDCEESVTAFSANTIRKNLTVAEEIAQFSMLSEKYSVKDLAGIFGKSESYISLRLNLSNLSGDWKEVLENPERYPHWNCEKLLLVAREPKRVQDCLANRKDYLRTRKDIESAIAAEHFKLKFAPFDAGTVCAGCKKRSDSCGLLFSDVPADDADCLDVKCYSKKELDYFKKLKAEKPGILFVRGNNAGYISWGDPLYEYLSKNNAEYIGTARKPKKGETPNAVIVGGPRSGEYVVLDKKLGEVKQKDDSEKLAELEKKFERRRLVETVSLFKKAIRNIEWAKEYDPMLIMRRFRRVALALGVSGKVSTWNNDADALKNAMESVDPDRFEDIFEPVIENICTRLQERYCTLKDMKTLAELILFDTSAVEQEAINVVPVPKEILKLRAELQTAVLKKKKAKK
jgi:hypothetical protein